jgi:hypothetical protein
MNKTKNTNTARILKGPSVGTKHFGVFGVDEGGQALLFVIVAMTIALTVGIGVTNRTVSSLRRTSSTDTASRVYAAAEGGIEWFLRQPLNVLSKLSDGDTNNGSECPSGTSWETEYPSNCILTYDPQGNDKITSRALISVKTFSTNSAAALGSSSENYWFSLNPGDVKEVSLRDFQNLTYFQGTLDLCWKSLSSTSSSWIYYLTYGKDGISAKQLVSPSQITPGTYIVSGTVTAGSGRDEYDSCQAIPITDTNGIRIKSLYAPSKVAIYPSGSNFPIQGYQITSLGQIDNVAEKVKATKTIRVYRSLPYAPSSFDYAIYTNGNLD